jgi:medium-chain acyl-[acyl-carrier-protein] hydrolase
MNAAPCWVLNARSKSRAEIRLFSFPHAGAGASSFRLWAAHASPSIEVCPVQLPGRENRIFEPPIDRIEELIDRLIPGLDAYMDRPFAAFGHSMGALIAYEFTRALETRRGPRPVHLLVSGFRAPHLPARTPPMSAAAKEDLLLRLIELGGIDPDLIENQEYLDLVLPVVRADLTLVENYAPTRRPPIECPISTFGGDRDRYVNSAELAAWEQHTRGSFTMRLLPGDHFYLHSGFKELISAIHDDLARLLQASSPGG